MRSPVPLSWLALAACAGPPEVTGAVEEHTLTSTHATTVDGDPAAYTILVRLPPGYADGDAAYPVIVQLDALFLDEFAVDAGVVSELAADGALPEAIVVGVGHPPGGTTAQRDRDFTWPGGTSTPGVEGHADDFLAFLREELVPWVDGRYRTTGAEHRTLSGHSSGGAFAFYAFTHDPPEGPILFEDVLSADWGFDAAAFDAEAALAARTASRPGGLFVTHALYNGAGQKVLFDALTGRLAERGYEGLRFGTAELDTDHGGTVEGSLRAGLPFLLGGGR